jgi:hypothetical protein
LEQHLNTAKERFVYYLNNEFNMVLGKVEVFINEFDNKETWENERIFGNTPRITIENALSSYKKKLKLERLYNPEFPESEFYSNFTSMNDVDKHFPFIDPLFPQDKAIEVLDRLLTVNLHKEFPLTKKQEIKFEFKRSDFSELLSGNSIYSLVNFTEEKEDKMGHFCYLQWDENEKNFSLFSNGNFLFFDSERMKLISNAFEEKLGFPVYWRPIDIL